MSIAQEAPLYLVGIDESEHAKSALLFACAMAVKRGGRVTMLHVLEPSDLQGMAGIADIARAEQQEAAMQLLSQLADTAEARTSLKPQMMIREGGLIPQVIAAAAEDPATSMLLLGVSSKTMSRQGDMIGKLAGALGDTLLIPILLVPGGLTDQQLQEMA